MNNYQCKTGFEDFEGKIYKIGEIIDESQYLALTSSEKRNFLFVSKYFLCV